MTMPLLLYDNRFRDGVPVASTTATGYNAASVADYRAYTLWQANDLSTQSLSVNCGANRSANAVAMIGHNLKGANADLTIWSSVDGNNWTQRTSAYAPASNNAFLSSFGSVSGIHWAVNINNGTVPVRVGELFLGSALQFPQPPDKPFSPYTARIEADSVIGKTGHILGSTLRYTGLDITAKFSNIDRTWVQNSFAPFWNNHARYLRPFFWAWDLNAFPSHVYYVTLKPGAQYQTPISVHSMVDSITLEMTGVMEE